MSATTVVEYDNHYEKMDVVAQFSNLMQLKGGSVDALLGYERFDNDILSSCTTNTQRVVMLVDQLVIQEPVSREVDSFFGEVIFPVTDGLEVNASFRSDDYSDVGSSESFKFGAVGKWFLSWNHTKT